VNKDRFLIIVKDIGLSINLNNIEYCQGFWSKYPSKQHWLLSRILV